MSILAVVGMKREAAIVAGPSVRLVIGGDGSRLSRRLEESFNQTIKGVISIGIAGGLSPSLGIGDCVIARAILAEGTQWSCDETWRAALLKLIHGASENAIASVRVPAASILEKANLHGATGAYAVDMESDIAARFAADRGLPFAALRVISDTAADALPPATAVALNADGGVKLGAVLRSVAAKPTQIPALIKTGANASRAFAALQRCRNLLGVGLGCPYLG